MNEIKNQLPYFKWICGGSLLLFVVLVAIAIVYPHKISTVMLLGLTMITAITFIAYISTIWVIKEMQPEEIKKEMRILELIKQDKKDGSNEELFNKFEALKSAISEIDSTIKRIENNNNS